MSAADCFYCVVICILAFFSFVVGILEAQEFEGGCVCVGGGGSSSAEQPLQSRARAAALRWLKAQPFFAGIDVGGVVNSTPNMMQLADITESLPYQQTGTSDIMPIAHVGQIKLFLSELEFLTRYLPSHEAEAVVVYAGSAPSHKLAYLGELFPRVKFVLVDPEEHLMYSNSAGTVTHYHKEQSRDVLYFAASGDNRFKLRDRWIQLADFAASGITVAQHNKQTAAAELAEHAARYRDERPYAAIIESRPEHYFIFETLFTAALAAEFGKFTRPVLFISDIRTNLYGMLPWVMRLNNLTASDIEHVLPRAAATVTTSTTSTTPAHVQTVAPSTTTTMTTKTTPQTDEQGARATAADYNTFMRGTSPTDLDFIWNSAQQLHWMALMRPAASMFKFKTPYFKDKAVVEYFADKAPYAETFAAARALGEGGSRGVGGREGEERVGVDFVADYLAQTFKFAPPDAFWLQTFQGPSSTETRLVISGVASAQQPVVYDCADYENKLFYYNKVVRPLAFYAANAPAFDLRRGIDGCADCNIALRICAEYCELAAGREARALGAQLTSAQVKQAAAMLRRLLDYTQRTLKTNLHGDYCSALLP